MVPVIIENVAFVVSHTVVVRLIVFIVADSHHANSWPDDANVRPDQSNMP
jgi:hypothetical protein